MNSNRKKIALVLALITAVFALRLIHLGADTPADLTRFSRGVYVDEGYKTLAPRNLVQYGSVKWNAYDTFWDWMKMSPFTQWSYYGAFRLWGVRVESGRIVSTLYFLAFICVYAYVFRNRYGSALLMAGLVFLGLESAIFFFSRIAIFEIAIILFLYLTLFGLLLVEDRNSIWVWAVAVIGGVCNAVLVKGSAILYMVPVFVGIAASLGAQNRLTTRKLIVPAAAALAALAVIVVFTGLHGVILNRLGSLSPAGYARRVLFFRLIENAPVAVVAGVLCSIHGLLADPKYWLQSAYRSALTATCLLTPFVVGIFTYNPLRYYVPALPAYILVCLEWYRFASLPRPDLGQSRTAGSAYGLMVPLFLLVFYLAYGFNEHLLTLLPLDMGEDPGLSVPFLFKWLTPAAAIATVAILPFRQLLFSRKLVKTALGGLLVLFVLFNGARIGNFLVHPSYASRQIRDQLRQIVPQDSSVAGDWAPFLTLGTGLKTLYVHTLTNPPERIPLLRPDYFLFCETEDAMHYLEKLNRMPSVFVRPAIALPDYLGVRLMLYPLGYRG